MLFYTWFCLKMGSVLVAILGQFLSRLGHFCSIFVQSFPLALIVSSSATPQPQPHHPDDRRTASSVATSQMHITSRCRIVMSDCIPGFRVTACYLLSVWVDLRYSFLVDRLLCSPNGLFDYLVFLPLFSYLGLPFAQHKRQIVGLG